MIFKTSDLCDRYAETRRLQIAEPLLKPFGGHSAFCGRITTLKVFEDKVKLRETLEGKSEGGVLVVDGGGSHRCALLDSELAKQACDNGWEGIIVYGCVRGSVELSRLPLGVRALHTHPLKAHERGGGDRDVLITFAGVNFRTGHYLYADEDGIVVTEEPLV
jgi:regulator of ribonuclease activity A